MAPYSCNSFLQWRAGKTNSTKIRKGGNTMRTNLMLLVLGSVLTLGMGSAAAQQQQAPAAPPSKFKLMSSAYSEGSMIPTQYSCADPNASSPALQWNNPPAGAGGFAVFL